MGLRDRNAYGFGAWDWTFLEDCFPRHLAPGDADGLVVLKNGYFLVLEGKRSDPSRPPLISEGQLTAFRSLSRVGNCTVIVVGGDPERSEVYWVKLLGPLGESDWKKASVTDVQRIVRLWAERYDGRPAFWETRARGENENWSD